MLQWEQARCDEAVADIFGYHSLQVGLPRLDGLRANRMPHQWLALGAHESADAADIIAPDTAHAGAGPRSQVVDLLADPVALPFAEASLDLVVLPHTLELSMDPHAALREVVRVLVPEGRVVISGLNPASLWGLRQRRARIYQRFGGNSLYLPDVGEFIGYRRLRDWLQLLSFEVETAHFGCYRPAVRTAPWLERFGWMDPLGEKWWPILGAAYFVVAVKRVHGMRLLEPGWRHQRQRSAAAVPVANRTHAPKVRSAPSMTPELSSEQTARPARTAGREPGG